MIHQHKALVEAVGVFDDYEELQDTIKDLGSHGFGRHQISVRGSESSVRQMFGHTNINPELLEDNPAAPRSAMVTIEELGVAQGVLTGAGIYIGAAIDILGTDGLVEQDSLLTLVLGSVIGGAIGAIMATVLGSYYARFFNKQAETGGLVLWVETPDVTTADTAQTILKKHGAHDIHVHDIVIAA